MLFTILKYSILSTLILMLTCLSLMFFELSIPSILTSVLKCSGFFLFLILALHYLNNKFRNGK